MRVGFNARLLYDPGLRGWNRYSVNLLGALSEHGVEPVLYADCPIHPDHLARLGAATYRVSVGAVRPYALWEQSWLPRQCKRDRVDVLHAPANFGLPWTSTCPRVLTLHDAIDQVYYAPRTSLRARWTARAVRSRGAHWVARTRAHRVITDSAHARSDLIDHLHVPAEKIRIVPLAADPAFHEPVAPGRRAEVRARHGLTRAYVFYVGGWEERKNVPFLLLAYAMAGAALAGVDLVLAGGRDVERAVLGQLALALGVNERVHLLGWVADADLPVLYAEALVFVYPSEFEGFGLPLCEAMATGCPILAARAACLPEVLGGGGETFGLDSADELAGLLCRAASEPAFRAELSRCALARSADFSWSRTAEDTIAVYRELV
jgi:glycosyltransferase involved in cell wall biosynthesis